MMLFLFLFPLAVFLYLAAMVPRLTHRPDFSPFLGRYYAHRGLYDNASDAPENTLAAFRKAIRAGYGFELDVQCTKDGRLIVLHDFSPERAAGLPGRVSDHTWEELKDLTVFGSQEHIPLFSDVLRENAGQVPMIVELKADRGLYPEVAEKAWEMLKDYPGVWCVESFHPGIVLWYKKHHPEIVRGQLSTNYAKGAHPEKDLLHLLLTHLCFNFLTRPDFIAYDKNYANMPAVTVCRKLYRAKMVAWTVSSQKEMRKLSRIYDIFIFEHFLPPIV